MRAESKSNKETIEINLSDDDYTYIKHAADSLGVPIEQFVEMAIYMQIIESLKNVRQADLIKVYKQEEEDANINDRKK
jgi:uncharacterized protein (DUF1778 family)